MTEPPRKSIRLGFERDCIEIPLEKLRNTMDLPIGIKESITYRQIRSSVQVIGLVEPIVVVLNSSKRDTFLILDGRMRVEALRDLGVQQALCLISTDDEGYTYNKRVNRLSVKQLAEALNLSTDAIRQKFRLLDGICDEVVTLLAEKPATYGMFHVLKQMKPFRQIDVAQSMVNLNNYSLKLANAMLQNTPIEQLTERAAAKNQSTVPSEAIRRLERELASMQSDTRLLEEGYGPASLELEINKSYIGESLLENAAVVRWLAKTHPDYLQQLQRIANIKELPTQ